MRFIEVSHWHKYATRHRALLHQIVINGAMDKTHHHCRVRLTRERHSANLVGHNSSMARQGMNAFGTPNYCPAAPWYANIVTK